MSIRNVILRAARNTQKRVCADLVTLSRDGAETTRVTAIKGLNSSEDIGEAALIGSFPQEWLIDVADYVISGSAVEPQIGDQIIDADGINFEILPTNNVPSWEMSGPDKKRYRIRTLQVD